MYHLQMYSWINDIANQKEDFMKGFMTDFDDFLNRSTLINLPKVT